MPDKSAQELLRKMQRNAQHYAEQSTKLSDQLEYAEQFLQQLPAKIEIDAEGDFIGDSLHFCRYGNEWRLYYGSDEDGALVTNASVEVKANAARLLPVLFRTLIEKQDANLENVNRGLEALAELPFLQLDDGGGAK